MDGTSSKTFSPVLTRIYQSRRWEDRSLAKPPVRHDVMRNDKERHDVMRNDKERHDVMRNDKERHDNGTLTKPRVPLAGL